MSEANEMDNMEKKELTYEEYTAIIEPMRPESGTPEWKAYWQKVMELSQRVKCYEIDGERYPRIAYGNEDDHPPSDFFSRHGYQGVSYSAIAERQPCGDCSVVKGQLHVPGCDIERCPQCHLQAISCGCGSEEE